MGEIRWVAHSSGAQGQSVGGRAECGLRSTAVCPHHGGWPHADERGGGGKTDVGGYCGLDSDESGCLRRAWAARGHQQGIGPPHRSRRTARIGRQLGRRKACGRAHFWPRGAEYASTRMVPRGGDAGRSVVDAQRGRLSSCWLCQLTALDHGAGCVRAWRGVGEWAWAFERQEG